MPAVLKAIDDMSAEDVEDWLIDVIAPKFAAKSGLSESDYSKQFKAKFGTDYTAAFFKETGKVGQVGTKLQVWQDYVAGTNPMDETDVFDATIAIEGGTVNVSHTPKLDADREALRKYTVYGKKNLMDSEWKEVEPGEELNYNFYRVTVRMK